jgi:hypothetical protein
VFGDCLVFGRVPVPYHLPCEDAFQRRGAEERDKESTVASFLYRGKDANQCTKERHKTCYGRKLVSALGLVFGDLAMANTCGEKTANVLKILYMRK